ncbi:MAG TPA: permease-like cell division protein FtsX [Longimicrobiaceae bacterium]
MPYALREALAAFRRTPLLALLSIVAVSLSLFVVGLFALTAFNIRVAIEQIESRVEVVAYLHDEAPPGEVQAAAAEIMAMESVRDVRYVSKDEALTTAVQELTEFRDVFTDLEMNPLPASLEVSMQPGQRDRSAVELVAQRLAAHPFVEDVSYGDDWVSKIISLRRIAAGGTMIIGGAFAAVAGIIIATAVRISVFARRDEIQIMRLVGATAGFIQRPFLIEGLISGLIGGVLAAVLTFLAFEAVSVTLIQVLWLPAEWALAGVLAGGLYGLLSSAVAVRRHLRSI